MRFYNFALDELRQPQPQSPGAVLDHRGAYLGDVLGALEEDHPSYKERLDAYLHAVVPDAVGIDRWFATSYVTVMLRSRTGVGGRDVVFGPNAMSDGTLRAAAVLAALFQAGVLDGRVSLVGIEEPELALHPAAAGVLYDALTEASQHVQVVATSQSPDLLDRDDLDVSSVRAVSMDHGLTIIGEVDDASRRIAKDKLYTLGELMRSNQISPEPAANGDHMQPKA
jgi:predicted ATPase